MNSNEDWSREEQARLEEGMLKSIAIIDSREKWKAVALVVGTRSARECAERFQACRAMARSAAAEDSSPQASESDEPDEKVEAEEALKDSEERDRRWTKGQTWNNSDCKGDRWKRQDKWSANWWDSSGSWQDGAWKEKPTNETEIHEEPTNETEIHSLDDNARRAIEARREVEANRERMRLREERKQQGEKQRGAKLEKEIDEKRKKHLDHVAAKEREFQEAVANQEAIAAQQKQRALEAKREAERTDVPFFGQRHRPALPKTGWAAKAGASKGEVERQRKQAEMERKAADVLANIGIKQPECNSEKSDNDQPRAPAPSHAIPSPPSQPLRHSAKSSTENAFGDIANGRRNANKKQRKAWWENTDSSIVCPISLAPICELPRAPFELQTEGSADPHYFDARFLANFLVSAFDFIDPVNRRPLTPEECRALDDHLQRNHPEDPGSVVSVADAFALFTQNSRSCDGADDDRVQREATAVLQHLFRFQSARRTDQRGRAINYADGGLTVVDDDDILTRAPDPPPSFDRGDAVEDSAFPDLAGNSTSGGHASTTRAWRGKARGSSYPSAEEAFPGLGGAKATAPTSSKAKGPPPKATAKAPASQNAVRGGSRAKQPLRVAKGWGTPA